MPTSSGPASSGGYGLDALWNDDFHHSALVVALTGRNEAYYTDYLGPPQEFVSAVKCGLPVPGPALRLAGEAPRHADLGHRRRAAFVTFIQNHDQVANSGRGRRLHQLTSPGRYRAMTALLLLGPGTPMLFQGQEFAASTPFLYFADHAPELARAGARGPPEFLAQFPSLGSREMQGRLPDPGARACSSGASWTSPSGRGTRQCTRCTATCSRLRREDPAFASQRAARPGRRGARARGLRAAVLRRGRDDDRLLLVNLGRDLPLRSCPEPLLAPPESMRWDVVWSSEDPRYGGCGTPAAEWTRKASGMPGEAAVVLGGRKQ